MHKVVNSLSKTLNKGEIPLRFNISKIAMHLKNLKEAKVFFFFTLGNKLRCHRVLDLVSTVDMVRKTAEA